MKHYRVVVTPFAADNIREAYEWYQTENPSYAVQWLEGIESVILDLRTFPESHGLAPESRAFASPIRQIFFGGGARWRIFFAVDGDTVRVLHVRHSHRDYWRP